MQPKTYDEYLAEARKRKRNRKERPYVEPEHELQVSCVNWFSYEYPKYKGLLFAVPNGGRRDAVTGGKLKSEGVVAGVSDLLLLIARGRYHGMCIEMKTEIGRQSEAQKEWQVSVEEQGYKYAVARSLQQFIQLINEYENGQEEKEG